jgi:hypothetical protein
MATIPAVPPKKALPRNPFHPESLPDLHAAYAQCLVSENEARSEEGLMYVRCLGYLLTEVPVTRGKHMVAKDIILCNGNKKAMDRLAQFYINHVIRLCESKVTKTGRLLHY